MRWVYASLAVLSLAVFTGVSTPQVGFSEDSLPPKLEIPAEIRPSGQYAIYQPKTDAVSVVYVGLDGIEPLPAELLRDGRTFVLDCRGLPKGRFRFVAVAAGKNGYQVKTNFVLNTGDAPTTPNPDPKPPTQPEKPPQQPDKQLWIVVVQPNGPISQELANHLRDPVWEEIKNKKVKTSRREVGQLDKDMAKLIENVKLPAVVFIQEVEENGQKLGVPVRPAMALPSPADLLNIVNELLK